MDAKARAEQYVDELYGVAINVRTNQTTSGARREFWLDFFEGIIITACKERDAEWGIVAKYFIDKADALKDVRRNVDAELIAALNDYYAAQDGLKAFIEEVK